MKMKTMLNQKILIQLTKPEKESEVGGIFVKTNIQTPVITGTIVMKARDCTLPVKEGDKVVIIKHNGTGFVSDPLSHDPDEFKIVSENDILGICQ